MAKSARQAELDRRRQMSAGMASAVASASGAKKFVGLAKSLLDLRGNNNIASNVLAPKKSLPYRPVSDRYMGR